jgi:uncharacterized protein
MKILIPDIPKEGLDVAIQETIEAEGTLYSIQGGLRVEKAGDEIMVRGDLQAGVDLQCSRCLKQFNAVLTIPVDVVYHPLEELVVTEQHEITSNELDLDFYAGDELDIERLLKEQVALSIPMKPLCSDSCKGFCPNCGTDLNVSTCSCSQKNIDPRFQELK